MTRQACEEYTREVEKLALKLLGLIARSLGLPENRFNSYFKDQSTRIRLNHYPPCPSPQLALGVGRHKDGGALTVLAQDEVGGLEVKRKTDGEWIRVRPKTNAYIINVGDIMQVIPLFILYINSIVTSPITISFQDMLNSLCWLYIVGQFK
jgi:isopenicillin N synthase-like dioxygenase